MTLDFRGIREEELPQWFEHVSAVFSKVPRSYFERHWYADPWRDLQGIRVAMDGSRIVGTVRVFRRRVYLGGRVVTMGGIGEVSTKPEYREQGISFRLLEDALRIMGTWDMAVSMLFSDRHGHYARHGWNLVRNPLRSVIMNPAPAPAASLGGVEFRQLNLRDERDLIQVRDLYTTYTSSTLDGSVARDDPGYWRDWVSVEWGRGFGASEGRQLVSYVALRQRRDQLYVQEYALDPACHHPSRGQILRDLLGYAVASFGTGPHRVVFPPIIDPENHLEADGQSVLEDWMLKVVRADLLTPPATTATEALPAGREVAPPRFWFWPTDWF